MKIVYRQSHFIQERRGDYYLGLTLIPTSKFKLRLARGVASRHTAWNIPVVWENTGWRMQFFIGQSLHNTTRLLRAIYLYHLLHFVSCLLISKCTSYILGLELRETSLSFFHFDAAFIQVKGSQ